MSPDESNHQNPPDALFAADPITGAQQSTEAALHSRNRHEPTQEILDDVHGFIELSAPEIRVLDHPALIRLKRLKQLGMAELVFPTATHARREHSIGTLHVAHLILEHLDRNISRVASRSESKQFPAESRRLTRAERVFTRLSALVHDIGHLPSGHTFEDELGLTDKHDHSTRLTLILDRHPKDWDASASSAPPTWEGLSHDELPSPAFSLRDLIDEEFADVAAESQLSLTASEIVVLIVGGDEDTIKTAAEVDKRTNAANARGDAGLFRVGVCRDIVSNTVSADLIDYLHRDWQHLGKPARLDQRLMQYMEIRRFEDPTRPPVLAVDLRSKDDVRTDAISGILGLLDQRYQLFETVLYHRTKLNAASMLERVVAELADAQPNTTAWLEALPERLLDISDDEIYPLLLADVRAAAADGDRTVKHRMLRTEAVLRALRQRNLHRKVAGWSLKGISANPDRIQDRYSHRPGVDWNDPIGPARNRLRALRLLEKDFGLQPLTLAMYCPPADMSEKIARVRVRVDDYLAPLIDLDGQEGSLTGGRLAAQASRFHQLWRVHFTCDRAAERYLAEQHILGILRRAMRLFVLDLEPTDASPEDEIIWITQELLVRPGSPYYSGYNRLEPEEGLTVARKGEQLERYPSGRPAISAFYRPVGDTAEHQHG